MTQAQEIRELAGFLASPNTKPVYLQQAVVAGIGIGSVQLQLSGGTFAVGNVRHLDRYQPKIGDTVWCLKNGPDLIVLDKLRSPYSATGQSEAAHIIGAAGEPVFENSWSNYGSGFQTARFWKDTDGWIHLEGLVQHTGTNTQVIFTLPSGYRPPFLWQPLVGVNPSLAGILLINTLGQVTCPAYASGATSAYVSLDNVIFPSADVYQRSNWTPLHETNGWTGSIASIDPDRYISAFMRDDGWCNAQGFTNNGTVGTVAFIVPEDMRGYKGNTYVGSGFSGGFTVANRVDVHRSFISVVAGTNAQLSLEGIHWFSRVREDDWVNLILQNSWVRFDNNWAPAQYLIDKHGCIHLRGLVRSGTIGTTITTLPVGLRPLLQRVFSAESNSGYGRADVSAAGAVIAAAGSNAFFDLSQITFRPEQ